MSRAKRASATCCGWMHDNRCALHALGRGLVVLDASFVGDLLLSAQPETTGERPVEDLTPRELEVVQLLAEGLPNKAIAKRLGVSDHTIKFHVNAILGKLGAQSRTEAVVPSADGERGERSGAKDIQRGGPPRCLERP